MTLTLNLPEATQQRLNEEAQRAGLPVQEYILRLIDQGLPLEYKKLPHDQWLKLLNSGGFHAGTYLTDEQMSRENMYD
jgi:hypothetical protein